MGTEELTEMKIDVAVLQERYDNICERLIESKAKMDTIDAKFDRVLETMSDEAHRRKFAGRIWSGMSHLGAIVVAVLLAKIFHEPLSLP
jgi:hypothetical protein